MTTYNQNASTRVQRSNSPILYVIISTAIGIFLLSVLSIGQKYLIGADPFALRGFLIPVVFGGLSGGLVGTFYSRIRTYNTILQRRVVELEQLNEKINTLETLLPICSSCKKIRVEGGDPDDQQAWENLESYISDRTSSTFTHGICPDCLDKYYPDED